ncbi:MAG: polysaccharide deacetylase family protein [Rhodocyclaceae bacterium]
MQKKTRILIAALTACVLVASAAALVWQRHGTSSLPPEAPVVAGQPEDAAQLQAAFAAVLAQYRQIIVLLADEKKQGEVERGYANAVGRALFHEKLAASEALSARLANIVAANQLGTIEKLLDYVESDPALFDADRLAFRELLRDLQAEVGKLGSLPAVKLHKRIGEDLDSLAEIEKNYEREISQIFSRFESRAIVLKRERWDDYLAKLAKLYNRAQILKEHAMVVPYSPEKLAELDKAQRDDTQQVFGKGLPPKTLVLTFDDGPHGRYTEEIEAILQQYGVPAVFFQVGRNLGTVEGDQPKLGVHYRVARKLAADGFTIANHSYSHAQLSKATGDALKAEVTNADALLKQVDGARSPLFRFPYGAHNKEALQLLDEAKLRSVMWNIDSLDWADPVPSSIADRVLRTVDAEGRGIVLFHDIHERTVKALPMVLDRLVAEGYQFAGWDGENFSLAKGKAQATPAAAVTTGYNQSWAVIIGVDEYSKWPRLQYAVRDAQALRDTLTGKFGFAPERVITLTNAEATRNGILSVFHDRLAHAQMQKNDRVLVFFAGHGATRKLSSGRDLGYIVPVDADPDKIATDGISMSEMQNIAESLPAKHALFIMDSCYSGLALTRGSNNYLRENAKRIGRQMLTAGGADQMVADGGPAGHSVFTWTLLQALGGKGDLNGDGYITATELAAYIAPAVSGVSQQTPAFGSLPGSQGGEFVFELPVETEFLSAGTSQLSGDAIALNNKLDAAAPAAATPTVAAPAASAPAAVVPDLQGKERTIKAGPAIALSSRQLAQRANDRGLLAYREKQYAEAEEAFTEALKLRPDFALAANNLGYVFYKQEKFAEAARWFEKAIQLDASRAVAHLNLGDALAQAGEKKRAQQSFRTYLELAPTGAAAAHAKEMVERL